mmetsp:Transcript_11191/g.36864  ORF Transcript_11191/g.36864 Transcript_11191/m.36864 type:complete len:359 (-) Transcript_11191:713-1789(-)
MKLLAKAGLSLRLQAQVCIMIAATVPFRGDGSSMAQGLHERLERTNAELELGLTPAQTRATVREAVLLANRDVVGFASDIHDFLINTWDLLVESNPDMRSGDCTIGSYRRSMRGQLAFLRALRQRTESIFNSFDGVPGERGVQFLRSRCEQNLDVGVQYLQAKLVASGLLEAVAEALLATGESLGASPGHAESLPISALMGSIDAPSPPPAKLQTEPTAAAEALLPEASATNPPQPTTPPTAPKRLQRRLEQFLPYETSPKLAPESLDQKTLELLWDARVGVAKADDSKRAPFAAFVYERLGVEGSTRAEAALAHVWDSADPSPNTKQRRLHECFPPELACDVLNAATAVVRSSTDEE